MEKLLTNFSPSDIILFVILAAIAIKGIVDFFDWAHDRLKRKFDSDYNEQNKQSDIEKKFLEDEERIKQLELNQTKTLETLTKLNEKVDMLIDSDKDDIKSFLTREHHYYCYVQGWIDDYSLECCERRYSHYIKENGNSFIGGFMIELRALPKKPPESSKDTRH